MEESLEERARSYFRAGPGPGHVFVVCNHPNLVTRPFACLICMHDIIRANTAKANHLRRPLICPSSSAISRTDSDCKRYVNKYVKVCLRIAHRKG